jgi:hypothetical protein
MVSVATPMMESSLDETEVVEEEHDGDDTDFGEPRKVRIAPTPTKHRLSSKLRVLLTFLVGGSRRRSEPETDVTIRPVLDVKLLDTGGRRLEMLMLYDVDVAVGSLVVDVAATAVPVVSNHRCSCCCRCCC